MARAPRSLRGKVVAIMGTSTCHMVLGDHTATVEGRCGVVEDGIVPGLFGFEAGQSGVGDIFAWFFDHAVPTRLHGLAGQRQIDVPELLEQEAAKVRPGVPVLFLDTGYHFVETIGTRDAVEAVYDIRVLNVTPEQTVAEQDEQSGADRCINYFASTPKDCIGNRLRFREPK